jgi:hypothetical protein
MIGIIGGRGPDQLQRDFAAQSFVTGAKNFSHSSRANLLQDSIVPDELADHTQNRVFYAWAC